MDARIVEFVEVLRQNGVRTSLSETQDAIAASAELGLSDRDQFRATLRATLCKRDGDAPTFDRAFELFFSGAVKTLENIEKSIMARIQEEGLLEGDDLKMILYMLNQVAGQMTPLTQAALQGDRGRLAQIFRTASLQLDYAKVQNALQTGFFSRRLLAGAGADGMRSDIESIGKELQARGVSAEGLEITSRYLHEALRAVEQAARGEVDRQISARLKKGAGAFSERHLSTMSRKELDVAQRAVRALAEKLKARLVRRQRSRKRGTLYPRRTLRKNLSAGGVPMAPLFKSRTAQRPDVVILCDVSDSVRNTSRLMLLFMHTLQSLFTRVRTFIFVSELGEVTRQFKELPVDDAIDLAVSGQVISTASNSNYGHALATFARQHLGSVTRRTTVLIIGDGRNNYNAANTWALQDLKRKARRVVWVATEPKTNWGFGDSEMAGYAKVVSQVVTVQTLEDLERIATQVVPTR